MKRAFTFLALVALFAQCQKDIAPAVPDHSPVSRGSLACDLSSRRPEIAARLIPAGTLSLARAGMAVAAAGTRILFAGANTSELSGMGGQSGVHPS